MANNEESNTWSKTLWKARLLAKAILPRREDLRGGQDEKSLHRLAKAGILLTKTDPKNNHQCKMRKKLKNFHQPAL